jgi:uncharacterized protein YkwD
MRGPTGLLAVGVVAVALLATASGAAAATAERSAQARLDPTLARDLGAAINEARLAHKVRRLTVSGALARAARQHALVMGRLGFFSHSSADGASSGTRITSFYAVGGSAGWAVGEVILWGKQGLSASQVLARWLSSDPHRAQILDRRWRDIGVAAVEVDDAPGVYAGRDVTIVVVDFGARGRSTS